MLAPTNLEAAVVDHQTLKVAERVEGGSRGRVNESHEADVLVRDVTDVVQKTTSDNVANFFDGGLGVDVAKVDRTVANVVGTTSSLSNCSSSDRLLSKSTRDQVAVSAIKDVSIARRNTKVLCGVLLLGLGNVRAAVAP